MDGWSTLIGYAPVWLFNLMFIGRIAYLTVAYRGNLYRALGRAGYETSPAVNLTALAMRSLVLTLRSKLHPRNAPPTEGVSS